MNIYMYKYVYFASLQWYNTKRKYTVATIIANGAVADFNISHLVHSLSVIRSYIRIEMKRAITLW